MFSFVQLLFPITVLMTGDFTNSCMAYVMSYCFLCNCVGGAERKMNGFHSTDTEDQSVHPSTGIKAHTLFTTFDCNHPFVKTHQQDKMAAVPHPFITCAHTAQHIKMVDVPHPFVTTHSVKGKLCGFIRGSSLVGGGGEGLYKKGGPHQ